MSVCFRHSAAQDWLWWPRIAGAQRNIVTPHIWRIYIHNARPSAQSKRRVCLAITRKGWSAYNCICCCRALATNDVCFVHHVEGGNASSVVRVVLAEFFFVTGTRRAIFLQFVSSLFYIYAIASTAYARTVPYTNCVCTVKQHHHATPIPGHVFNTSSSRGSHFVVVSRTIFFKQTPKHIYACLASPYARVSCWSDKSVSSGADGKQHPPRAVLVVWLVFWLDGIFNWFHSRRTMRVLWSLYEYIVYPEIYIRVDCNVVLVVRRG